MTGVDINPFAVAIARFRLMVAALKACGLSSVERAPMFPMRVATGDSLLEWGTKSSHQGDLIEVFGAVHDGDVVAKRGTEELRTGLHVETRTAPAASSSAK